MNNSSNPAEIRNLLSQITDTEIDESVTVFTPFHINYWNHTKIGKNVFINFDCVFFDLGGITIEDNVLDSTKSVFINRRASNLNQRPTFFNSETYSHQKKMRGLVQMLPYLAE